MYSFPKTRCNSRQARVHASFLLHISMPAILILTEGENRAFGSEDEEDGGDELGEGGAHGVRVDGVFGATKGEPAGRHGCKLAQTIHFFLSSSSFEEECGKTRREGEGEGTRGKKVPRGVAR